MPKSPDLTEEQVDAICKKLAKGMTQGQACRAVGVSLRSLTSRIRREKGNPVERPDWREKVNQAQAGAVEYWIGFGTDGGLAKNSAQVKFAEKMLFALDKRFRETKDMSEGQVTVINYIGQPGTKQVEAQVVQGSLDGACRSLN